MKTLFFLFLVILTMLVMSSCTKNTDDVTSVQITVVDSNLKDGGGPPPPPPDNHNSTNCLGCNIKSTFHIDGTIYETNVSTDDNIYYDIDVIELSCGQHTINDIIIYIDKDTIIRSTLMIPLYVNDNFNKKIIYLQ